jgi:heat shock protein 1/8
MGKKFGGENQNETNEINTIKRLWPFECTQSSEGNHPVFIVDYKKKKREFRAEEISALILAELKSVAEKKLNAVITNAVITCPAYFNDSQRQATKDAARIAGLNVMRMINEPTAAALAYGLKKLNRNMTILVYDLGGGTLDVSLLELNEGIFEVKATNGNNFLGGQDFDNEIVKLCVAQFMKQYNFDLTTNPRALRRLQTECQKAKHFISTSYETEISIPDLADGKDFTFKLNRAKFEKACLKRFQDAMIPVRDVLKSANISVEEVDEVILIGGSTRIPKIQELLQEEFPGKKLNNEINPDEAVAIGSAIQGAMVAPYQNDKVKDDELNRSEQYQFTKDIINKEEGNGDKGINKSQSFVSGTDSETVSDTGDKPIPTYVSENPAIQKLSNITLIDVTPLSLGIAVGKEDKMSVIIAKNTSIPIKKKKVYTTLYDNQKEVTIPVYQGENPFVKDNHFLGQFQLKNIPPAKAGVPRFDTIFEIDANGILQVTAQLHGSKDVYKITIERDLNMKKEELQRSIINTQEIIKDKQLIQTTTKVLINLSGMSHDLSEKGADSGFKKLAHDITEWCDNEGANASLEEIEKKMEELKLNYKKTTGKDLVVVKEKTVTGDPFFDDVDPDLLE